MVDHIVGIDAVLDQQLHAFILHGRLGVGILYSPAAGGKDNGSLLRLALGLRFEVAGHEVRVFLIGQVFTPATLDTDSTEAEQRELTFFEIVGAEALLAELAPYIVTGCGQVVRVNVAVHGTAVAAGHGFLEGVNHFISDLKPVAPLDAAAVGRDVFHPVEHAVAVVPAALDSVPLVAAEQVLRVELHLIDRMVVGGGAEQQQVLEPASRGSHFEELFWAGMAGLLRHGEAQQVVGFSLSGVADVEMVGVQFGLHGCFLFWCLGLGFGVAGLRNCF